MLTVGSLFSGIGGIELGLEATGGFRTIWHSEIDEYACKVLAKHWPDVPNHGDITTIDWSRIDAPDVLCGGLPCQDISVAGKGAGIKDGTRSGLWFEFANAIRVLRPRYVLIENVAALIIRGLDIVLGDLAEIGYDAEWATVQAAQVGAPHKRERVFIVAYPQDTRPPCEWTNKRVEAGCVEAVSECGGIMACNPLAYTGHDDTPASEDGRGIGESTTPGRSDGQQAEGCDTEGECDALADADIARHQDGQPSGTHPQVTVPDGNRIFQPIQRSTFWDDCDYIRGCDGALRAVKPGTRLLDAGIPDRVAKLRALGNSVVPQCAEYVGRCILNYEMITASDVAAAKAG